MHYIYYIYSGPCARQTYFGSLVRLAGPEYMMFFLLDICFKAVYIVSRLTERVGAENMKRTFAADYYYFYFWFMKR